MFNEITSTNVLPMFYICYSLLVFVLTTASIIDIRTRTIPNWIPLILCSIAAYMIVTGYVSPYTLCAGVLIFLLTCALKILVERLFQLEGSSLGGGDIKLLSALALCIGFEPILIVMLIASMLTIVRALLARVLKREDSLLKQTVPWAPYISVAFILLSIFELFVQ